MDDDDQTPLTPEEEEEVALWVAKVRSAGKPSPRLLTLSEIKEPSQS